MRLLKHIFISTVSVSIFALLFRYNPLISLISSIAGSLILDILDHGFNVIFSNSNFVKKTRIILRKKGIVKAYQFYYSNRKSNLKSMILHNLPSYTLIFLICIISSALYQNYIAYSFFVFGIIFHQAADLYEDLVLGENIGFWIKNKTLRIFWGYKDGETR